jgi:carboxypeptidase PM20D1
MMKLKRIIGVFTLVLLLLIIIVVVKTYTYPFQKTEINSETFSPDIQIEEKSISRLTGGIRIPTISNEIYENTDFVPFGEFKRYLISVYPLVYEMMDTFTINDYGLVYRWKGKNPDLKPVLFLGHYDVVPVAGFNSGDLGKVEKKVFDLNADFVPIDKPQTEWEYSPFSGAVANGRIYGRGTLDMKGMVFSMLEAADTLLKEGFQPDQDIWFAFGHDEETGGEQGAVQIAKYLEEHGMRFDVVYDEGGIIADAGSIGAITRPIALIGVGEKGFLTLKIKVRSVGGHTSMPPKKSSLVLAAEIIKLLNDNQLPARIIPPVDSFLNQTGRDMNLISRLAISNQWLFKPMLLQTLSKSPAANALVRTTAAISMAKGSDAPNVLSSVAEVTVNFRLLQGDSVYGVIAHVKDLCKDYDVEIEVTSAREASGISPHNTKGFEKIRETVNKLYPEAIVSTYITVAGTDAYKYQRVSENIYRFMPVLINQHEQNTMHNENENISIDNYARMIWYFKELMKNY